MADFPVCPSSERTESELPPFCRGAVKPGRFYRKVVSANLFADTFPKSTDCTAQSLSRCATAPFTQGSPCRVPHRPANHSPNSYANSNLLGSGVNPITTFLISAKRHSISYLISYISKKVVPAGFTAGTAPIFYSLQTKPLWRSAPPGP